MARLYPNGPEFWEEEINAFVKRQLQIGFPSVAKALEIAKDRILGLIESEVKNAPGELGKVSNRCNSHSWSMVSHLFHLGFGFHDKILSGRNHRPLLKFGRWLYNLPLFLHVCWVCIYPPGIFERSSGIN